MVHPVVEVEPELQLLALRDLEVLEQAHIPIEIPRSIDRRQVETTVLAGLRWRGEAIRVDVLMRFQSLRRIARQDRVELDVGRTEQRDIADGNTIRILGANRARNNRAAAVDTVLAAVAHAKVLV